MFFIFQDFENTITLIIIIIIIIIVIIIRKWTIFFNLFFVEFFYFFFKENKVTEILKKFKMAHWGGVSDKDFENRKYFFSFKRRNKTQWNEPSLYKREKMKLKQQLLKWEKISVLKREEILKSISRFVLLLFLCVTIK